MHKRRSLILLSGGLDSTAVGLYLKENEKRDIYGIFINRGQTALRNEREALQKINKILKLKEFRETSIEAWGKACKECGIRMEYLPRNTIFVLLAIPFGLKWGCEEICLGNNKADRINPECTEEYINQLSELINKSTRGKLRIRAPLIKFFKSDIVKQLAKQKMAKDIFRIAFSCYGSNAQHCGLCQGCSVRQRAFHDAKVVDQTRYEKKRIYMDDIELTEPLFD